MPVRQSVTEVGHVVRALYLEAGVVDVAAETGDTALLKSSADRWADMVAAKTYLTGGNGSRHSDEGFGDRFELPPDRAYNETCAAIASFHWSWRLLLATGDARYADHMERVLYNGFGSGVSADGRRFFYVNPLQRREDHFEQDDPGRRREWFSCSCCPPNIMRLIASLDHYIASTGTAAAGADTVGADTVGADTLYLHLLTGSRVASPAWTSRWSPATPGPGGWRSRCSAPPPGSEGWPSASRRGARSRGSGSTMIQNVLCRLREATSCSAGRGGPATG